MDQLIKTNNRYVLSDNITQQKPKIIKNETTNENILDIKINNKNIKLIKVASDDNLQLDEKMIIERGEDIEQIAKDIKELHEAFVEFNEYVNSQGETINLIENNVNNTDQNISIANTELHSAENYQKSTLRKKLILTTLGLTAINVPIGLIFGAKVVIATSVASLLGYLL